MFELHELINTMLGKTSGLTYEVVRERYEHFRARCAIVKNNTKTRKRVRFAKGKKGPAEDGCTEPLYGERSKCVLQIVPESTNCETLSIDKECIKERRVVSSALKHHTN
jgi:hypothetical protein